MSRPVSRRQSAARLKYHRCLECGDKIPRPKRGPHPKLCPDHRKALAALQRRVRARQVRAGTVHVRHRDPRMACCRESGKGTCPQHETQRRVNYDDARGRVSLLFGVLEGFHLETHKG